MQVDWSLLSFGEDKKFKLGGVRYVDNALKDKARKVWISYGIFMILLPFLGEY